MKNIILNIPYTIKIFIWKKYSNNFINILLIGKNNKFTLTFFKKSIFIDKWSNSIVLQNNKTKLKTTKINNTIFNFLNSWNKYFYNKIKFKGKGFRIKFFKKIKLIKFYFGKSHKTFFILKKIKRKKINKYKFILLGLNNNKLKKISKKISNIKNINLYTLRGLRISRQIIYKRKGKKGTYI